MKVDLICSDNLKRIIQEMLELRNITLDEKADVVFVEKGCPKPEGRILVLFDYGTLDQLVSFLDSFNDRNDVADSLKGVITGKSENRYELIPYGEILFFEGSGNTTQCITAAGSYKVKEKLYELEQNLMEEGFVRIGKPYIVNILNVAEIIPWFGGRFLLKFKNSDREVEVARNYARSFKEYLGM